MSSLLLQVSVPPRARLSGNDAWPGLDRLTIEAPPQFSRTPDAHRHQSQGVRSNGLASGGENGPPEKHYGRNAS